MTHQTLHIDFESRSTVDLKKTGTYVYAKHETTDLWCACYAFDDGWVKTWQPSKGTGCPPEIANFVKAGGTIVAHNAAFERIMWTHLLGPRYGWPVPDIEQWRCTMVMAYAMALPGSLENAAPAAGLNIAKDAAGRRLMLSMARPRKIEQEKRIEACAACDGLGVTDEGGDCAACKGVGRIRKRIDKITWWDVDDRIKRLIAYCKQDVEVERELSKRLRPLKQSELDLWHLDQKINDRGVYVDVLLCNAAKRVVETTAEGLNERMRLVTGGDVSACSNRNQILSFIRAQGVDAESIAKDKIDELLAGDLPPLAREVLEIRKESAKASVAKIDALLNGKCPDNRTRGLLQFHAATTGRWAGRRFQPQNLVRTDENFPVADAIDSIMGGYTDLAFDEPLHAIGQCIRGFVRAGPGKKLIAVDYRNIEGRMLAFLAGEQWKLDAFRAYDEGTGPDLYKVAYGRSYNIAPDDVTKPQRQIGKVMELALGYQGGVGAFKTMGVNYGVDLPDEEVEEIRDGWRMAHPNIKQFWWDLEEAAIKAVDAPGSTQVVNDIVFRVAGSFLFMRLPSKRFLCYPYPKIVKKEMPWEDAYGRPVIKDSLSYFSTIDPSKRAKVVPDPNNSSSWARIASYGGMLAENATQAAARDILAYAMPLLERGGYSIVLTTHDEAVAEVEADFGSADEMGEIMVDLPEWADGCPITVEGWEAERYRK